ncbi:MAG: alanine racemase [Faecalibacterium sp.]
MKQTAFEHHTWAEIDLDALTHNFTEIQKRAGGTPLCAVVKADAYGHGAVMVGKTLLAAGAKQLAVSCLAEAIELRSAGITADILLLGHTDARYTDTLIAHNITQSCYNLAAAEAFSAAASALPDAAKLKVHLKLDTGMGRIGFALRHDFDTTLADVLTCYSLEGLAITGVFQHFAVCDSTTPENITYTEEQHALFTKAIACLTAAGHAPALAHCNNSAGTLLHPTYPETVNRAQTMARPGIILYGLNPSDEVTFDFLKPVMRFKTVVSHVKTLEVGESTSYGRHFVAEKPTVVATLCAGYADGYPRLLSRGKGTVQIHGTAAKILGNVCMDQLMIDVTDIPNVQEGDEVFLWGGTVSDSADEVANKIGTIGYEIVCGVSRRVPRVYIQNGKPALVVDYLQYGKLPSNT